MKAILLPIEENNKTTPTKAHEMISVCNKCGHTYIQIFISVSKTEIIEFIKIGNINQERHSN